MPRSAVAVAGFSALGICRLLAGGGSGSFRKCITMGRGEYRMTRQVSDRSEFPDGPGGISFC